jgi:hypothetical protein
MSFIGNSFTNQTYVPTVDYFNGNASTTAFTLSRNVASVYDIQVVVENVPQNPSSAFTVSGNTITFTSAPPSGSNNIYVRYTTPTTNLVKPAPGTVGPTEVNSNYSLWNLSGANINYTAGSVGVGVAGSSAPLDIQSDTGAAAINIRGRVSGDIGSISFYNNANSTQQFYIQSRSAYTMLNTVVNSYMAFATNNTEAMRIDSSGRVQIGTTATSPASADTYGIVLGVDGAGGAYAGAAQFSTNGSSALVLNRGSDNGSTMTFRRSGTAVGSVTVTTSTTAFNTSSDYRLKKNVLPMTGALATVAQLKPCTYKWKIDDSDGQGFIAHELQAVIPDAVSGEKDAVDEEGNIKPQGIDTSFLVATLTAAIQEQQAIIEELKSRIEVLEAK